MSRRRRRQQSASRRVYPARFGHAAVPSSLLTLPSSTSNRASSDWEDRSHQLFRLQTTPYTQWDYSGPISRIILGERLSNADDPRPWITRDMVVIDDMHDAPLTGMPSIAKLSVSILGHDRIACLEPNRIQTIQYCPT